jgi:hypothetical protein
MNSVSIPGRGAVAGVARRGAGVRGVAGAAATVAAVAGSLVLAGPAWASGAQAGARQAATGHQAAAASYTFTTLDDAADPAFNQLLAINSHNVIAGYFGSGAAGHPNKGYLLNPPYGQADYVNENFPGSAQTQVTGLNNLGDSSGFWVGAKGTNRGFVEWNGVFASYTDPKTPHTAGAVNQLLGINNAGIAVGFYNDAGGNSHAYQVNQATSQFTPIRVPGVSAVATGINNAGDVVGFATDAAGTTSGWLRIGTGLTAFQFPGGTGTQALGINSKNQIVGSYLDGSGALHGFVLTNPLGPRSHWQTIDDPNGAGSTVVNGINSAGDLAGFYTDAAGNTDGMLATRATTVVKTVTLAGMPSATATFGRDGSGNLTVALSAFGLTPGSSHAVDLQGPGGSGTLTGFSTLTADGTGQADATLSSTDTCSIPDGSVLVLRNGSQSGRLFAEPIAETGPLSGVVNGSPISLTATAIGRAGTNYGTPRGEATLTYNPGAQTLTVKVSASGLIPGLHAAHIHLGSCMSQGPVRYMLTDLAANRQGTITNANRVITGVTTPVPASGWYLNIHQGNSNVIVKNGQPTIFFRPMLCSGI